MQCCTVKGPELSVRVIMMRSSYLVLNCLSNEALTKE